MTATDRPIKMRRLLIGLTLLALLAVSIGIGVLVAQWPKLRHQLGDASLQAERSALLERNGAQEALGE
jgi:hypothetical protein